MTNPQYPDDFDAKVNDLIDKNLTNRGGKAWDDGADFEHGTDRFRVKDGVLEYNNGTAWVNWRTIAPTAADGDKLWLDG